MSGVNIWSLTSAYLKVRFCASPAPPAGPASAVRCNVTVIGTRVGPLPSVPAIAVARSWCIVPIVSPIDEILNDVSRLGSTV